MSLINKVLIDLDQRGAAMGSANSNTENDATLHNLPFSEVPQRKNNVLRYVVVSGILLALTVSGVVGFYLLNRPANENIAAKGIVAEQPVNNQVSSKPISPPIAKTVKSIPVKKPQAGAINRPEPRVVNQPASKVVASKQTKSVKNRSQPISAAAAIDNAATNDKESNFSKNKIPMRSEQRAEVAYQSAYDDLKSQKTRSAEQSLRQALALTPSHVKARELLSGVYIKQGRWVEASELLRNGLSLSPGHRTFSKLYARTLMQLKQDKRAISVLQQHAPSIKTDPDYYAMLAALYQRQKDHVAAAKTYQEIVKIQPRNGVWWVGLGISLEALGESKQASQAYSQARKSGNLQNEIARFTNNRLVVLDEIGYPSE